MYGHKSMDWSDFIAGLSYLQMGFRDMTQGWLLSTTGMLFGAPSIDMRTMELARSSHNRVGSTPPFTLMHLCQERKCREQVDRVWALLGLLDKDLRQQIENSGAVQ